MARSGALVGTSNEPQISDAPAEDLSPSFQVKSERFSTSGLSDPDRVGKWEDHNAKALVGLGARTINDVALEATEINLHLPNLHFAHVSANAHVIERTSAHIRTNPADSVVLYFSLFGEAFFYHKDGVRTLTPGTVLVYDTDKPFMRGFAKGLKELVLMVPRNAFADISEGGLPNNGEPQILNFGKSNKANDYATSIAEIMSEALNNPEQESLVATEDKVFDLMRGIFASASAADQSSQYRVILAFIDRNLRNPDLSAFMISSALGISGRQLSRIFASQGSGLSKTILTKRLELARRALLATDANQMSVSDVSVYSGFNSNAHFSRVFKEFFGFPPSELRRNSALQKLAI